MKLQNVVVSKPCPKEEPKPTPKPVAMPAPKPVVMPAPKVVTRPKDVTRPKKFIDIPTIPAVSAVDRVNFATTPKMMSPCAEKKAAKMAALAKARQAEMQKRIVDSDTDSDDSEDSD